MKEWGPVQVATPSADFNVHKLPDDPGWLVSCHHPDILTYVSPHELANRSVSEVFIGLTGRSKRDQRFPRARDHSHPHHSAMMAVFVPPNNSLKLTRRAGARLELVWPAGLPHNPGQPARFRRAA